MRRFEYEDNKSWKYWEIEVRGEEVLTHYGRMDSPGQETVKVYTSTAEAQHAASKLVASKLKKGYVEVRV